MVVKWSSGAPGKGPASSAAVNSWTSVFGDRQWGTKEAYLSEGTHWISGMREAL
jgi:hypothetical protein